MCTPDRQLIDRHRRRSHQPAMPPALATVQYWLMLRSLCCCCSPVQCFMKKVVEEFVTDTDYVWIHDYHLLVLPSLLRKSFNKIRWGCERDASVTCHGHV